MRNFFYLFFALLCFTSCGNGKDEQHSKTIAAHHDSLENKHNPEKSLQHVQYNCPVDSKQTPYHGTLKTAVSWEDKKGKNILIIAERPQYFWKDENKSIGKYCDDPDDNTEVTELFAWQYVFDAQENKWKSLWTLNDFEFGCCDVEMEYVPYTLRISDLDSNGIAESIFTYASSAGDGPIDDFWQGKLILHSDTLKYSIKGNLGNKQTDTNNELIYSKNFDQLSPRFKNYGKQMWKYSDSIQISSYKAKFNSRLTM